MSAEAPSLSDSYPNLRQSLPRSVHVHVVNGEEIVSRRTETRTIIYETVGDTMDPEELVEHDGPALIDGYFYYVQRTDRGDIRAYSPTTGSGPRLTDEFTEWTATMLSEAEQRI